MKFSVTSRLPAEVNDDKPSTFVSAKFDQMRRVPPIDVNEANL